MAVTFLQGVQRIFTQMALIRGDTDLPTSFSDTQHNASLAVAQVAVQNELIRLIARRLIPKERSTAGSITTVSGTRVYDLASGFLRFYGEAHLYNSTDQINVGPYAGGLVQLQLDDQRYATAPGYPNWFYDEPSNQTLRQIGFYLVPNVVRTFTYDYETSSLVTVAADNLPFHSTEECYAFIDMASRRFKYMWEDQKAEADIALVLEKDFSYREARTMLYELLRTTNPQRSYGHLYG